MASNLAINDKLLRKAMEISGLRTKEETVTRALEEFIERRQQKGLLRGVGQFEFREDWDYRKDRIGRKACR